MSSSQYNQADGFPAAICCSDIQKALPVSFPFAQFELSLKETQALHSTKEQKMALASFIFRETAATSHHWNGLRLLVEIQ